MSDGSSGTGSGDAPNTGKSDSPGTGGDNAPGAGGPPGGSSPGEIFRAPPAMIIVVSGPSGVGKTVICDRLVEGDPDLVHSVSATTRPARSGEVEGKDYHFWSMERFRSEAEQGFFLEWAEVHGNLYGTPRAAIEESLARGKCPVLDVDVQGGRSVKSLRSDAVLILVVPPSMKELERRLRGRGTDRDPEIQRRLDIASRELAEWEHYDYVLVNDDLEAAIGNARSILAAERLRVARRLGRRGRGPDPRDRGRT